MVMIIRGDDFMRSIRRGVFETNSSSSHSLTLIKTLEKSKLGKLKSGKTYDYKPLGEKWTDEEYKKLYNKEFDKLCICLDLLFDDFSNKAYKLRRLLPAELEKFREKDSDTEWLLTRRYVFNEFKKSANYREFQQVLKKHNIDFVLNDLVIRGAGNKQRYPISCDNFVGYDFDFLVHIAQANGWSSIAVAVENIVFNPDITLFYHFYVC